MAKKNEVVSSTTAKTLKDRLKILDKVSNNFNDKKGQIVCGRLSTNQELLNKLRVEYVKTPSLNVNAAMGGGFPRRRCSLVVGNEDSGKTFLCLETIAHNMKENPEFVAGWLESEKSLTLEAIVDMFDIDPERFYFYELEKDGAAEDAIDLMETIVSTGVVDMFVVNSLKCLVPKKEYNDSMSDQNVAIN